VVDVAAQDKTQETALLRKELGNAAPDRPKLTL